MFDHLLAALALAADLLELAPQANYIKTYLYARH